MAMEPMEVAREVAVAYGHDGGVTATMVAGSLGRDRADKYSDVEVDVYWVAPPRLALRRAAIHAASGERPKLWEYEPGEGEWSDDFMLDGLSIGVSGFTVAWLTEAIGRRSEFDMVTQMRLSALLEGTAVLGGQHVERWRAAFAYTDELGISSVSHWHGAAPLMSWRQWRALAERDDTVLLNSLCTDMIRSLLGLLCVVNHVYVSHPGFKWATHTMAECTVAPENLSDRLLTALDGPTRKLAQTVHDLYSEALEIVRSVYPMADVETSSAALHTPRGR